MSRLTPYLLQLQAKTPLTEESAEEAMTHILEGADPYQVAAFLALLKYRGEAPREVVGMIRAIEKKALLVSLPGPTLDIVGTGGDLAHTVNISTGAAILAAACGVPIAKHGNRSVSSRSGSADVLEALGVEIEIPPDELAPYLEEVGLAFMFAPTYHPAFKQLSAVRQGLKLPTIFNILGPLLNPAGAEFALIGVASLPILELMSEVIVQLGSKKRALVFHGSGLDELTSLGPIMAYDIYGGKKHLLLIDPQMLGFAPCKIEDLQGGDATLNAAILQEAFAGRPGAVADALALTAGAALWIFDQASSLEEGINTALGALREGKALNVLKKWKEKDHD
jgi:anthranilate phosphoribosyltransferase